MAEPKRVGMTISSDPGTGQATRAGVGSHGGGGRLNGGDDVLVSGTAAVVAFDRGDLLACGLHREHGTALDGPPLDQDRAGAALTGVAAHVGAGQVEVVPQ